MAARQAWIAVLGVAATFALVACGDTAPKGDTAKDASPAERGVAPNSIQALMVLPNTQTWTMTSSDNGRTYQIFLALPQQPAPEAGYPAIYVTDANAMFATTVDAARAFARRLDHGQPAVVVGIGYPESADIRTARAFDLTPTAGPATPEGFGGADDLLNFIESELKPEIAKRAPVNLLQQTLMGHSFGGLFVLHTLFNKPTAFQTYIAASPSIWWNDEFIYKPAARLKAKLSAQQASVRVLLTAGEYEQIPDPDMPPSTTPNAPQRESLAKRAQVSNAQKMQRLLADIPGVAARTVIFQGEDHGTVVPAAISRGVRVTLGPGWNRPLPPPAPADLAGETPIPVPSADAYIAMTPESRYDLRLKVRGWPDAERKRFLAQLKFNLDAGLSYAAHEALHNERNAMDEKHGTKPIE